jgi:hypothetical protein
MARDREARAAPRIDVVPLFYGSAPRGIRKDGQENKRAFPEEGPSKMARLAGFEPTTPWFVAKYSIQLSYSRTQNGTALLLPGNPVGLLV